MQEITSGGAESVLECVGNQSAITTAIGIVRPGGAIGYIDVPHGSGHNFNLSRLFMNNIILRGGAAPARAYPELLADTVAGKLNASAVLDLTVELDGVSRAYAAMAGSDQSHGTPLKNLTHQIWRR